LGSAHLDSRDLAVDLACGTGQVAFALAPHFQCVHAIDQEPEMIEVGRRVAQMHGIENVTWDVLSAENVRLSPRSVDMVAIGNAFHRVHRPRVAGEAYGWLRGGGAFAEIGCTTIFSGPESWKRILSETLRRCTSPQAQQETYEEGRTSSEVLSEAGFEIVRHHEIGLNRTWTLDEIIGFAYSTSVASKKAIGDAAGAFEADLRAALLEYDASGSYAATMTYYFLLARKSCL
jgi:ubiquinone/menaquinone biosynthesis C-methylase UbiE